VCIKVQSAGIQLRTRTETTVHRILQTLSQPVRQRALATHRVPHSTGIPPHQMEVNAGFTDLGLVIWAIKMASLTTWLIETVKVIINSVVTGHISTSVSGRPNALAKFCTVCCFVVSNRVPCVPFCTLH